MYLTIYVYTAVILEGDYVHIYTRVVLVSSKENKALSCASLCRTPHQHAPPIRSASKNLQIFLLKRQGAPTRQRKLIEVTR